MVPGRRTGLLGFFAEKLRTSKIVDLVRFFWQSSPKADLLVIDGVDFFEL
jgi:hypothetical protein